MSKHDQFRCDGEFRQRKFIKKKIILNGKLILVVRDFPIRVCNKCGDIQFNRKDIILAELFATEMETKGQEIEYELISEKYKGFS